MPPQADPQKMKDLWDFNFTNHKPTAEGIRRIEGLRSAAKAMKDCIIDLTPAGRDQSLALTNLEQMLFHANAAVARSLNEDLIPEEDKALEQNNQSKEK